MVGKRQGTKKYALEQSPAFVLTPLSVLVHPDDSFNVSVMFDPHGQSVVATDVVLNFDKEKMALEDIVPATADFKVFVPVKDNGAFDKEKVIDRANNEGIIRFGAAVFDWQSGTVGHLVNTLVDPLATLSFKAKAAGDSSITFGFEGPGRTTDTNIVIFSDGGVIDALGDPSGSATAVTITGGVPTVTAGPSPTPSLVPSPTPTPLPSPTATLTPLPTVTPTPLPTTTPLPLPTATPTSLPTNSPTVVSTPLPTTGQLSFSVRFQGINRFRSPKTVDVVVEKEGQEIRVFHDVPLRSDRSGLYSGAIDISGLKMQTYDIFIKGWAHLRKKFAGVNLGAGNNHQDWSNQALLAGDLNDDNLVNGIDLSILLNNIFKSGTSLSGSLRGDLNADNFIDGADLSILLSNIFKNGD